MDTIPETSTISPATDYIVSPLPVSWVLGENVRISYNNYTNSASVAKFTGPNGFQYRDW